MKSNLRIIYMGTPDFAVAPLNKLLNDGYNIVAVVTMPDKPANRGQKITQSPVKEFALQHNLPVLQPEKLKDEDFLKELASFKADLQIVVAFRMLPKVVWDMPRLGTFNLHASLLPKYRGAAPINWAIINGDKESGVTTFFLDEDIDTGNIIMQAKTPISENDTAGDLHDRLMEIGSDLVTRTVDAIESNSVVPQKQNSAESCPAPKFFKETCKIDWNKDETSIYNQIRGFSPYPCAWFSINDNDKIISPIKIFASRKTLMQNHGKEIGTIISSKNSLDIYCNDGYISILEIQIPGKKRMDIQSFLAGHPFSNNAIAL